MTTSMHWSTTAVYARPSINWWSIVTLRLLAIVVMLLSAWALLVAAVQTIFAMAWGQQAEIIRIFSNDPHYGRNAFISLIVAVAFWLGASALWYAASCRRFPGTR